MAEKTREISYEAAVLELEELLAQLEGPQSELDSLERKIGRARDLLRFCRAKLRDIQVSVNELQPDERDNQDQHAG